jgi:hypothetical protein
MRNARRYKIRANAGRFQFEKDTCGHTLSYGAKVEALEPATLLDKVVELAESVIAFYAGRMARA